MTFADRTFLFLDANKKVECIVNQTIVYQVQKNKANKSKSTDHNNPNKINRIAN